MGDAIHGLIALSHDGLDNDDAALIVELAAVGTLDWSPKKNWVDREGGLPRFIKDMALHMMQNSGLTREHAIAASVERTKVLAAKGNRRAVTALAQWEKMKASAAAKRAAKKASG